MKLRVLIGSGALDFDIYIQGKSLDRDTAVHRRVSKELTWVIVSSDGGSISRSAGFDIAPVLAVDLVHGGKVIHVGQEDIDLDDLENVGSGSF